MAGQLKYEHLLEANDECLESRVELTNAFSRNRENSEAVHGIHHIPTRAVLPPELSRREIPHSIWLIILSYLSVPKVRMGYSSIWLPLSTIKSLTPLRGSSRWAEKLVDTFLKSETKLQQPVPEWCIGTTKWSLLERLDRKLTEKIYENNKLEEALDDQFLSRKLMLICLLGTLALPAGIALWVVGAEKDSNLEFLIPGFFLLALFLLPAWMCCAVCCYFCSGSEDLGDGDCCPTVQHLDLLPEITRKCCCPTPKTYIPTVSEINFPNREELRNTVFLFQNLLIDRHLSPEADFQAGMARLLRASLGDIFELKKGRSIATSAIVSQGAGAAAERTLETPLMQDFDL